MAAFGLFVGGALLVLGLSGLLGAVLALPAGPALIAIREGRPPATDPLARAVASAERSQRWGSSAALLSDLALLKLIQAEAGDIPEPERLQRLQESQRAQEASLARAPASTDGWARLTFARYALSGLDEASRDALAMSFRTGRLERAPMVFRVQLLLQEWEALDPAMRALGSAQIRQLARYHRRDLDALIDVYRASDRAGQEVIRAALWDSSEKDSSEADLSEEDWSEDRARFEGRLRRRFPSER